jgi:hypothetical protein
LYASSDAWKTLERHGRVVATTDWDGYLAIVLAEWLNKRGIHLLDVARDLRPVMRRFADEQDLPLLVVSSEDRRYADELTEMDPSAPGAVRLLLVSTRTSTTCCASALRTAARKTRRD